MDGVERGAGWGLAPAIRELVTNWREGDDATARAAAAALVRVPMPQVRPVLDKEVVAERLFQRAAELGTDVWIQRLFTLYPRQGLVWSATADDPAAIWDGQAILAFIARGEALDDPALRQGI